MIHHRRRASSPSYTLCAPEEVAKLKQRRFARDAMGNWLRCRAWEHFLTLTTVGRISSGGLLRHFRTHYVRRLASVARQGVAWFAVVERTPGGQLHLHALTAGTAAVTETELERHWVLGIGEAQSYSADRRGPEYITKTLGCIEAHDCWDLSWREARLVSTELP